MISLTPYEMKTPRSAKLLLAMTVGPVLAAWPVLALLLAWQAPGATFLRALATAGGIVVRLAGPPIVAVLAIHLIRVALERWVRSRWLRFIAPPPQSAIETESQIEVARSIVVSLAWFGFYGVVAFLSCYVAMMT